MRKAQQRNCWFRCGCLDGTEPAPILVPVLEQHIRRSPHHPDHADGCPFEMGDIGSLAHARRLREPEPGDVFRLVGAIRPGDAAAAAGGARTGRRGVCKTYDRDKLSQLLFKLLSDAGVHRVGRGPRGPGEQWEALYKAAHGIPLGDGLRLSDVLHTDPGQLGLLLGCIRSRQRWPRMTRPHGVLVFVAVRIEGDVIVAASGVRLAVEGPIGVFGPGRGSTRNGPFIVAVLVASPDGCASPVPMKAYAQPCWSADDILPLDSGWERVSLDILVRFQAWMAEQGYAVGITKPLYDRAKHYFGDKEPDQVVKPDFEGTVHAGLTHEIALVEQFRPEGASRLLNDPRRCPLANAFRLENCRQSQPRAAHALALTVHAVAGRRFLRTFVTETMGFDTAEYRARKARLKQLLTRRPGCYLEHVTHGGAAQAGRDVQFRKDLFAFGKLVIQADKRKTA